MMSIADQIRILLPVEPINHRCESELAGCVRQSLEDAFHNHPCQSLIVERVHALLMNEGAGAATRVAVRSDNSSQENRPLLFGLTKHFMNHPTVLSTTEPILRHDIITGVGFACAEIQKPPFNRKPDWGEAPLTRAIIDYVTSRLGMRGVIQFISNWVRAIEEERNVNREFDIAERIRSKSVGILHHAKDATEPELNALAEYPSENELFEFFDGLILTYSGHCSVKTLDTYRQNVRRYLRDDVQGPFGIEPRGWGGRLQRSTIQNEYDHLTEADLDILTPSSSVRLRFLKSANDEEAELIAEIQQTLAVEPKKNRAARSTKRSRKSVIGEDSDSPYLFRHITRHTPGVLSLFEIALALGAINRLYEIGQARQASIAGVALFGGVFYGWTKALATALISPSLDPFNHPVLIVLPDLPLVSLRPSTPIGWPQGLIPVGQTADQYDLFVRQHQEHYEPVNYIYRIATHPVLAGYMSGLLDTCIDRPSLLTSSEYESVIHALDSFLQEKNSRLPKLTPGRLYWSFRGYADYFGLDAADQYVLCGRAQKHQEMPINYTGMWVADTCQRHWQAVNGMVDEVRQMYNSIQGRFALPSLPDYFQSAGPLPVRLEALLTERIGSWSLPKYQNLQAVLEYLYQQSERGDLPIHVQHNALVLLVALELGVYALMRPFEIESMRLPAQYQLAGHGFAHIVKAKGEEHITTPCAYKYLPTFMQERFWRCIRQCTVGYNAGPILCLLDQSGSRIPLNFQREINQTLAEMGLIASLRVYGLRHWGRTLYRKHGLREATLDALMQHYALDDGKLHPLQRISRAEDEACIEQAAFAILSELGYQETRNDCKSSHQ